MITQLSEIVAEARSRGRKRLAVAWAADAHTLAAVAEARRQGLVTPVLVGQIDEIKKICAAEGIDSEGFEFEAAGTDVEAVSRAVALVAGGQADVLMKGLVSTDKYMRGILNKDAGLFPPKGTLSHVSVVELPGFKRLVAVADVAVIPLPDFKQKVTLIGFLVKVARSLGITSPKVACIAPSEQLLPAVVSSTDGAILAKMADRGQLGSGVTVDGPLSLDVALYPDVVREKKVTGSTVAGAADCLLFPNIESGNVFFKCATHIGHAEIAAMVVGTNRPCVLTSRGDTPLTKLYSIALACLNA